MLGVLWVCRKTWCVQRKGWCKWNNKTFHCVVCYISNSHIFVNIPPKSPRHRPHKCREQQLAPTRCLHEMLLLKRFPKAIALPLPLIFSPNKSMLCFCFILFSLLLSHPQPQMHLQNFCPSCFLATIRYLKSDCQG